MGDHALWIAAALIAAAAQTARNAAQSSLTKAIGTLGATQVRFLFGLPFAALFLLLVSLVTDQTPPALTARAIGFTAMGAVAQIAATALMLLLMQSRSFAVTTAWLKTEPVLVAVAAALILRDPLSVPMLAAIGIATAGVLLMTVKSGTALLGEGRAAATGLFAALLFGISAIGFRGGITALPQGDFLIRATTILVLSLALQSLMLGAYLGLFNRPALTGSVKVWRSSLFAGFLGAFASQFWFIGFSLTSAANIRTLALVEVIFALGVSRYLLRQPVSARQLTGMVVIVAGIALLLRLQA
ncbi:MAG: EamA family transporter [Cypionkella sp.]